MVMGTKKMSPKPNKIKDQAKTSTPCRGFVFLYIYHSKNRNFYKRR